MLLSTVAQTLSVLGRSVALTTAALAAAFMAWLGYDMLRYVIFSENATWGEVGVLPFVIVLRIIAAGLVTRGIIKLDARSLFRVLLVAGIGSFLGLYGWYFMLVGPTGDPVSLGNVLFLAAIGDLILVAAGLLIGGAILLQNAGVRPGSDHTR